MNESAGDLLTAKQVAKIFACSTPLVYKMADRNQLPCVRWDCPGEGEKKTRSMVRFKQSDVSAFIESHREH